MVADETGIRGLELLNGGEILGGGAMMFARSEGLFSPLVVAAPRRLLPGLLICIGDRGRRLGLGGFRSPEGDGLDELCSEPVTRRGSWRPMLGRLMGEMAAESEDIR